MAKKQNPKELKTYFVSTDRDTYFSEGFDELDALRNAIEDCGLNGSDAGETTVYEVKDGVTFQLKEGVYPVKQA